MSSSALPAKNKNEVGKPKFRHSNECCIFLGGSEGTADDITGYFDMYFCRRFDVLIVRFSDRDSGDYRSHKIDEPLRNRSIWLEAKHLAITQGHWKAKRTMKSLAKCPFCEGTAKLGNTERDRDELTKFFVFCTSCGARTKDCDTVREAQEAWAKRPVNHNKLKRFQGRS